MKTKADLKLLFEKGDTPTQEHFYEWMDSYWHKDERNIGTIDYTDDTGAASTGNTYKKVENPNDGNVYVLNIDGTATNAGTFGKNVANSTLTSIPNASLNFGANWKMALNGYNYTIEGLQNKSSDTTFSHLLGKNSSGDIAEVDGKTVFKNMPALLSSEEKSSWFAAMNSLVSYNSSLISFANPPVVERSPFNQNIVIKGNSLNLPANSYVGLVKPDGQDYNSKAYSSTGDNETLISTFLIDSSYPLGISKVKVLNSGIPALGDVSVRVVDALIQIPITNSLLTVINNDSVSSLQKITDQDFKLHDHNDTLALENDLIATADSDLLLRGDEDWWARSIINVEYSGYQQSNILYFGLATNHGLSNIFEFGGLIKTSHINGQGYFLISGSTKSPFAYGAGGQLIIDYIKTGNIISMVMRNIDGISTVVTSIIDTQKNYILKTAIPNTPNNARFTVSYTHIKKLS